ncbi:hypothetical protein QC764_214060 [Podospora pseudoanserina]|uniref:Uncharacterized protein n=1 Tax=Podospora pseudoanserina TaxID=2609844 RepID=A0ABR0IJB0_9PEZI|nr:hypothetical protein QC764_214060 [Podospora pseudoanserina]
MSIHASPLEDSQDSVAQIRPPPPKADNWRDAVYFSTIIRHSSKIYEFFGISRSSISSSLTPPTTVFMSAALTHQDTPQNGTGTTTSTTMSGLLPIQTGSTPTTQSWQSPKSDTGSYPSSNGPVEIARGQPPETQRQETESPVLPKVRRHGVYGMDRFKSGFKDELNEPGRAQAGGIFPTRTISRTPTATSSRHASITRQRYTSDATQTLMDVEKTERVRAESLRRPSLHRRWGSLLQSASPLWFATPASLALLAMIMRLLPRISIDFRGLRTISDVFFMGDLILFSIATPLFLLRVGFYPRRNLSLPIIERDSLQFAYLPLWATSFLGLVMFAGFVVAEGRVHPARGWGIAVYVCWWIGMVWAVATGFAILTVLMSSSSVKSKTAHGRFAPLLAVLGGVTGVATGALIGAALCLPGVGVRPEQHRIFDDRLAEPVIFFSICAVGAVLVLTMIVYSVLMHELLLVTGWPPPELTTAIFFFIGPLGQAGAALLFLGDAAGKIVFPPPANYGSDLGGVVPTATDSGVSGDDGVAPAEGIAIQHKLSPSLATLPLNMIGLIFALLLAGMAITWLVLAFINLLHRMSRRELYWNSSWNGLVFNIATISITSLWLSLSLESPFFRIATCIFLILSLLTLLGNLVFLVWLAIKRGYCVR